MKKIILIAVLILVALPVFAYTRSPSGLEIYNPVHISVIPSDFWRYGWNEYMAVKIGFSRNGEGDDTYSNCYTYNDYPTGFSFDIDLPISDYKNVFYSMWAFSPEENPLALSCIGDSAGDSFEGTGLDVVFTIIETPAGGVPSLFSVPMASSSDMLASTGVLFTDLWVIIALVIGIPLAFYIITRVSDLVPKDTGHYTYNKRGEMTGYWKEK